MPDNRPGSLKPSSPAAAQPGSRTEIRAERFEGPLPHPSILREYEAIHPGAAEAILAEFRTESEHQREMAIRILTAQIREARDARIEARFGQVCALIIAVVTVGTGGYVAVNSTGDHGPIVGGLVSGSGLAALVTAFIQGRKLVAAAEKVDKSARTGR